MAVRVGIGEDAVARISADHGLKPWRVDAFKIRNDPRFEQNLVDVIGLYLNPPARVMVFSFDEKTRCQALDRTQPSYTSCWTTCPRIRRRRSASGWRTATGAAATCTSPQPPAPG